MLRAHNIKSFQSTPGPVNPIKEKVLRPDPQTSALGAAIPARINKA